MTMAKHGTDIPEYWRHEKTLVNNDGDTVAMMIAYY